MVCAHIAHQALRTHWCWALLDHQTVQCYGLIACGLRNVTYTMVWLRMAHQTLQIPRFDYPWVTKRYVYNVAGTHCSPNITNTIVRWRMAHQTLHIKWFGGRMAHQTLQLQWFECPRLTRGYVYNGFGDAWLTKPYKYNGLIAHGSRSVTYTMVGGGCLLRSCMSIRSTTRVLLAQWIERWYFEQ